MLRVRLILLCLFCVLLLRPDAATAGHRMTLKQAELLVRFYVRRVERRRDSIGMDSEFDTRDLASVRIIPTTPGTEGSIFYTVDVRNGKIWDPYECVEYYDQRLRKLQARIRREDGIAEKAVRLMKPEHPTSCAPPSVAVQRNGGRMNE